MNAEKLNNATVTIGYSGHVLSVEQRVLLSNSLVILQAENHFKNVYLWGLILGQEADYYIAYGYEKDALFGRKFFYRVELISTSDNFRLPADIGQLLITYSRLLTRYQHLPENTITDMVDWGVLPAADEETKRLTELCSQRFQGDPALVTEVIDDDPGPLPDDIEKKKQQICLAGGDLGELDKLKEDNLGVAQLKEEDRLAATVEIINHEAVILPRGGLMKQPEGRVIVNTAFEGLSYEESMDLISYVHYRKPMQKWKTNLIARKDYNYALDFLDALDVDLPKGCWSLQKEMGGRMFILRNLYWPGFTAYHMVNQNDWGYLYCGNGRKNLDVPFMIFS